MPSLKLLVLSRPDAPHLSVLTQLPPETEVVVAGDAQTVAAAAAGADVILNCTGDSPLLEPALRCGKRVRWVHSLAAGVENQLIPELVDSEIPLTNSRGVFKESLGEFVIGAAIFFAKDFGRMLRSREAGRWDPFDVEEISRQTMGIAGYGEIGRAAGRRAKAMGMTVLAMRRTPGDPSEREVDGWFAPEQRLEMIGQSDYIIVAAPLTPETRGMIGHREFEEMKPSAVVVNVGRGPVIDETALVQALRERRIRGAALDVFDTEPLPPDHPLWKLDNVLLSPHCADHTDGWLEQAVEFFVGNFRRFAAGQPLLNIVDKQAGY
jgi:phosphoglycerate dehydrogenase-like enzyme